MPVRRTVLVNVEGITHQGELVCEGGGYSLHLYRVWSYLTPRPDEYPRGVLRRFRADGLSQLITKLADAGITVSPSEWRAFREMDAASSVL